MKKISYITSIFAAASLAGCNSASDESSTESSEQLPVDDVVVESTGVPASTDCLIAVTDDPTGKQCFMQDAADPAAYSEVDCSRTEAGKTWVKAYPKTPSDTEIWVLLPDDDETYFVDPVGGLPITQPPSLIYSPGPTFESRACNIPMETVDTCPGPIETPPRGELQCLGVAAAKPG